MIRKKGRPRRAVVIALILAAILLSGVMVYPRMYENVTGYTLLQPTVDTAHTDIQIPDSSLFSRHLLDRGAKHIENDVSFMRGCTITRISYAGDDSAERRASAGKQTPDRRGSEAKFLMSYRCSTFNERTSSMSPSDTYVYLLTYDPQQSQDGTGWITTDHGNG